MNVYDLVHELSEKALARSSYHNMGHNQYSYAFGWLVGNITNILDEMNLTEAQLQVLNRAIKK